MIRPRVYITGTDTDVGKTMVSGLIAHAMVASYGAATVVKIAQTGIAAGAPGDADVAASFARCAALELARFPKPADPWTAAVAAGSTPLRARPLAERLRDVAGALVVEGSGGAAVPLNPTETISDVALYAELDAIVVVGVRLGCISHTILTLRYLQAAGIRQRGVVLSVRWPNTPHDYVAEVETVLRTYTPVLAIVDGAELPDGRDAGHAILTRLESIP
jgi:dethiobiotin synthetase